MRALRRPLRTVRGLCCCRATHTSMSVEIRLSRIDRVYTPGQTLKGVVNVHGRGAPLPHEGISLVAEGQASLQLSAKSVGLFEAFYSSIKPVQLLMHSAELQPPGKLPDGGVDFDFEIELKPALGEKLLESYHGVFINIQYVITVEVRRGMLNKNLKRSIEFIIEAPEPKPPKINSAPFSIVPESLENVRKSALHHVPTFKIPGQLDTTICNISLPLTGEVVVEECTATIKSIELQLVRVETCSYNDGMAREATEIQNIQIADGPICHHWPIPIHMVFPRLFTCPTVSTRSFKVDFEVNLVILFSDGHLLTENFPLKLCRASPSHAPPTPTASATAADLDALSAASDPLGAPADPLGDGPSPTVRPVGTPRETPREDDAKMAPNPANALIRKGLNETADDALKLLEQMAGNDKRRKPAPAAAEPENDEDPLGGNSGGDPLGGLAPPPPPPKKVPAPAPAPAPAPQKAPALDPLKAMMEAQEADPLSRMDLVVDPVDDDGPLGPLG